MAVADGVRYAVTSLDIEALNGRVGSRPGGYVGPDEAALELLEELVDDWIGLIERAADGALTTR